MITRPLGLLLLGFATFSYAQQAPVHASTPALCPIEYVNINPTGDASLGQGLMSGGHAHDYDVWMFVLKITNKTGKTIKGMKFQAAYLDATEDSTDIPVTWNWTDPLKAGDTRSFRWENEWHGASKVGWKVGLVKALFDDGTTWEPSESSTCIGSYWKDKKHK